MDAKRWQRIWELFHQARALEPAPRAAFLDQACREDETLRVELESLLAADGRAGTPLDASPTSSSETDDDEAGRDVGAYRLLSILGRGGMGAVYLAARRDESFRQQVAIKLIKRGMDTDEIVRRFRAERQILSDLVHPNIARMLDGGNTADGLPYFVMEYVEGEAIDKYCDRMRLGIRERLALFLIVCGALEHAHRNLVVHRDLKPSNVLVSREGQPKLLDFGIAKLLAPGATSPSVLLTATGVRVMTPEYASPEQLIGSAVTTSSDVYSLGVMLYVLLAGSLPYSTSTRDPELLARAIQEGPPSRPSTAASHPTGEPLVPAEAGRLARLRGATTAKRLARLLAGDLDNIVLKALRPDLDRRYGSVAELAGDIERYLQGLPVTARRDTWAYRSRKFLLRHRAAAAAAAIALLIVVGAAVLITVGFARAVRAEGRAQEEATASREVANFLADLFSVPDPSRSKGETITARELLDRGAERIRTELVDRPRVRSRLLHTIGETYHRLGLYDRSTEVLQEALALSRDAFGTETVETGDILDSLGAVAYRQGRFELAHQYSTRSIAMLEASGSPDPRRLAARLTGLANIQQGAADYDDALRTLERVIEIDEGLDDSEAVALAHTLTRLGTTLMTLDRDDEAMICQRRAVGMLEPLLGAEHPDLFYSVNAIGILHWRAGRFEQARPWFARSLRLAEHGYGPDHPFTGSLINNFGRLLRDLGEFEHALPMAQKAVEIHERALGPEHPELANSLANLAGLLREMRRGQESLPIYERAIRIQTATLGEAHPHLARTLEGYAEALRRLGLASEAAEAEARAAKIHAARENSLGS